MKFSAFKEYKKTLNVSTDYISDWLATELMATIRELRVGLNKLTFEDNFDSFTAVLEIAPLAEIPIRNEFRDGFPTKWLAVRKNEGGIYVCDGDTPWDVNYLYLKNTSATLTANLTVVFLK